MARAASDDLRSEVLAAEELAMSAGGRSFDGGHLDGKRGKDLTQPP